MVHPEGYKEAANPDYGRTQRRIGDSGWWEKVGKWKNGAESNQIFEAGIFEFINITFHSVLVKTMEK